MAADNRVEASSADTFVMQACVQVSQKRSRLRPCDILDSCAKHWSCLRPRNPKYMVYTKRTGVTARRNISVWARRTASVAVAYLFAVQLILAAAVSAQMVSSVSSGSTEICHEVSLDAYSPSAPSKSSGAHGVFCAVCAFAAHAPSLPPSTHFQIARYAHAVGVIDPAVAPAITRRLHDPRTSQGPPANV